MNGIQFPLSVARRLLTTGTKVGTNVLGPLDGYVVSIVVVQPLFSLSLHLECCTPQTDCPFVPIARFGIVAAMSKNAVIGVAGGIPWKISQDRRLFKSLTDKSIMIIGKRTFEEHPKLAHINHTRHCIVVSKSMVDIIANREDASETNIELVRSFPEALSMARVLSTEQVNPVSTSGVGDDDCGLCCWVAGGERLYEEALQHESSAEVHLSVVDVEIDIDAERRTGGVAMFPTPSAWGDRFHEVATTLYPRDGDAPSFTYHVYKRKDE